MDKGSTQHRCSSSVQPLSPVPRVFHPQHEAQPAVLRVLRHGGGREGRQRQAHVAPVRAQGVLSSVQRQRKHTIRHQADSESRTERCCTDRREVPAGHAEAPHRPSARPAPGKASPPVALRNQLVGAGVVGVESAHQLLACAGVHVGCTG